jgi:GTP-binding protein
MFVDEVEIEVLAGNGGNGAKTFRREKYVPLGGPNGGDGGHGGSVIFEVDVNVTTLLAFRYRHKYKAERGVDGAGKDMFGKNGSDLVLKVPLGTMVYDVTKDQHIADLNALNSRVVIARGGVGGRGNAHFATSIQQAPQFAEQGEPGEQKVLRLELKLLADVGLLGFPNAGKSTLISAVSAARPKVGAYPFTTLVPHLGVVRVDDERSFVMADIPGIIEGASEGAGLGHRFLKHISRSRVLVHLLDVGGMSGRNPLEDYRTLNRELALFDEALAALPQLVVLNKMDLVPPQEELQELEDTLTQDGVEYMKISAATRTGLDALVYRLSLIVAEARSAEAEPEPAEGHVVITAEQSEDERWTASVHDDSTFVITGKKVERTVLMTDLDNEQAVKRLQKTLSRLGINRKLKTMGAKHGDTVKIGEVEFNYEDEVEADREYDERASAAVRRKRRRGEIE